MEVYQWRWLVKSFGLCDFATWMTKDFGPSDTERVVGIRKRKRKMVIRQEDDCEGISMVRAL